MGYDADDARVIDALRKETVDAMLFSAQEALAYALGSMHFARMSGAMAWPGDFGLEAPHAIGPLFQ